LLVLECMCVCGGCGDDAETIIPVLHFAGEKPM